MDLEDLLNLLGHTQANDNSYSETSVENPMDDLQLPESHMDSYILQEIERNSVIKDQDIIDLNEFKDILDDMNEDEMLDAYTSIPNDTTYNHERNDIGLITETKALLDLDESNDVLGDSIKQDETDVQHIVQKTDIYNNEYGSFDNAGKIEIKVSIEHCNDESEINSFKTSLPNFQDAFKMFVNAHFNTTPERVRKHNVFQYDKDNTEYSQKHNKESGLKITNTDLTDDSDKDITLVEDQTEIFDSILENYVNFLVNDGETGDKFTQKVGASTMEYDSDCPGYHSSDFEFISESEAEMDGLLINNSKSKPINKSKKAKTYNSNSENKYVAQNVLDEYYNSRRYDIDKDEEERVEEHKIPEGDEYFNLFQGNNEPAMPMYYMMENKSIGATSCMAIEYEGIGFDMRTMRTDDDVDDELKEDAKRSIKKILDMYPFENYKRKRRH